MLPGDGTLVDPALPAPFLWKMRDRDDLLTDYEQGGTALNQAGGSLVAQTWTFGYTAPDVWVQDAEGNKTVLFSKPGITELAGAFDQNMNQFVAYVDATGAHFWWYDTTQSSQVFTDLPSGSTTPRCCMDEHRAVYAADSDIILAYKRSGNLCYRRQRDRYATEYVLESPFPHELIRVGMNTILRLQFEWE